MITIRNIEPWRPTAKTKRKRRPRLPMRAELAEMIDARRGAMTEVVAFTAIADGAQDGGPI